MTPQEAGIMKAHAEFCRTLLDDGRAVIFGPVADPAGFWGLGILQLPEGENPQEVMASDPVVKADAGFAYNILPMMQAATR